MRHDPNPHPLDAWIRQGQPDPMDESLQIHFQTCSICTRKLEELRTLQATLDVPGVLISEKKAGEIRFLLEAECNRKQNINQKRFKTTLRFRWVLGFTSIVVVSLVVFFGIRYFLQKDITTHDGVPIPKTRILPDPDARWNRLVEGLTEIVFIEDGTVRFEVKPLQPGQVFLVKVRDEWVEVRGTRFAVTVARAQLQKVEVTEGVVFVHVNTGNILLLAGQHWNRPVEKIPQQHVPPAILSSTNSNEPTTPNDTSMVVSKPNSPVSESNRMRNTSATVFSKTIMPDPFHVDMKPPSMLAEPIKESEINVRFSHAYRVLQSGNWRDAVHLFSDMLQERGLGQKRADVLFWLAQAHIKGGQYEQAITRLRELIQNYPRSWRAKDATEQLRLLQNRSH